ncbi:MAG: D-alanyl-D-alanine carboxypeptidase [Lachnospiraceae bacterium]|nr:D-alanyl-D-alanine carboxypeptidase [Lachnospiraceae bacterium]
MKMKRAGRKRQKGCLAIFLAGLFLWAAWGPAAWGEEPGGAETSTADVSLRLYAQSAVLMDGDSGRVLYEKDGYHSMPMASTTKIMTCILALENGNLDDMLTVSSYAASMPKVHLGVKAGERYRLEDLLYSLMLESHNDSAVVIAEGIGGSVEGFASMMNQKARDIGAYDTFFVTPNGLDATALFEGPDGKATERAHSTTAADLARILRYCIVESPKSELFLAITQADSHQFADGDGRRSFGCFNHNAFLHMMDGALTGKTGFTGMAGYCYVGAVQQDGELYIVALLACGWPNNRSYKWSDMRELVEYGLEHYAYRDVWQEPPLTEVLVTDGVPWDGQPDEEAYVALKADYGGGQPGLSLLLREEEEVVVTVRQADSLKAPVEAGTVAGTVTYRLGEEVIKSYSLVTVRAVEKRDFAWCCQYLWQRFLLAP